MSIVRDTAKITSLSLRNRKPGGEKIAVITAYDYTMARLVDEAVDVVLVGDSLGNVFQGQPNTLPVTLDHMIYHAQAVSRGLKHAHLVVDMPFMSYQISEAEALRHAGRLLAEGNAEAVKIEGGIPVIKTIEKIVEIGIPVMGHIGLTPQSVHAFGGYKIQGKTELARESILQDAIALEDAGVYSIVLEGIPSELAKQITERVKIPTIGIGAGVHCDGQVLVINDLLGMNPEFHPRFVKKYADLAGLIRNAVTTFAKEIKSGEFPDKSHSFYVNS